MTPHNDPIYDKPSLVKARTSHALPMEFISIITWMKLLGSWKLIVLFGINW
jgi:hypothetical protein